MESQYSMQISLLQNLIFPSNHYRTMWKAKKEWEIHHPLQLADSKKVIEIKTYVSNIPIYYSTPRKKELFLFSCIFYIQYRIELVLCPFVTLLLYKHFPENYFGERSYFQS